MLFDISSVRLAGRLTDRVCANGHGPGFADIAIAATAGIHDLTVLTRNLRHFAPLDILAHDPFRSLPDCTSPASSSGRHKWRSPAMLSATTLAIRFEIRPAPDLAGSLA